MYPRKTHKQAALTAWRKLMRDQANGDDAHALVVCIQEALHVQRQHWTDPKLTPHPGTYLNGRRWEDEVVIPTDPPGYRRR
jgi:hypothetical protein